MHLHDEVITGNNENLVKTFLENRSKKSQLGLQKEDEHGSNCWNHQFGAGETYFVNTYNNNFPQPFNPSLVGLAYCSILCNLLVY